MSPNLNDCSLAYSVGLREVIRIVEKIHPFKNISLLAHEGMCLPCDDFLPFWFSLGRVRSKMILKSVEKLIYLLVRHCSQHLKEKYKRKEKK